MNDKKKTTWTRATTAIVLLLIGALCSAAAGPLAAGGQEVPSPEFGQSDESQALASARAAAAGREDANAPVPASGPAQNSTVSGSLLSSSRSAPNSNKDQSSVGPVIVPNITLKNCDATKPVLFVEYRVNDEDGIADVELSGMVGIEPVADPRYPDPSGATEVGYVKGIYLYEMRRGDVWNKAMLNFEASDVFGATSLKSVYLEIDIASCSFESSEWNDEHLSKDPFIVTEVSLSGCPDSPALTLLVDIEDEDIIDEIYIDGDTGDQWVALAPDVDEESAEFSLTEEFDLKGLGDDSGLVRVDLFVEAYDRAGNVVYDSVHVEVDLDNCTYMELPFED